MMLRKTSNIHVTHVAFKDLSGCWEMMGCDGGRWVQKLVHTLWFTAVSQLVWLRAVGVGSSVAPHNPQWVLTKYEVLKLQVRSSDMETPQEYWYVKEVSTHYMQTHSHSDWFDGYRYNPLSHSKQKTNNNNLFRQSNTQTYSNVQQMIIIRIVLLLSECSTKRRSKTTRVMSDDDDSVGCNVQHSYTISPF